MSESATPESGPLSVDQAVAALMPPVEQEQAQEAPVEAAEGEPIEAEASPAEETDSGAETPADGEPEEPPEEAATPLDPPLYWKPDAKAQFAELPPELQAVVLQQEGPREEAAAKAKADAASIAQTATAEIQKVQQLADSLTGFLPQAIEAFRNRWGDAPDWRAYAEEHGADAMILAKVEHEEQLGLLQQTAQATQAAQAAARDATVKAEFATLAEIAPELADPVEGPKRRTEITQFLLDAGLTRDAVQDISAIEMTLARDAMQWRAAKAALKARPTPAPTTAPAQRSPVRPAAGTAQTQQRSSLQQAQSKFNLDPSAENAAALMLARRA